MRSPPYTHTHTHNTCTYMYTHAYIYTHTHACVCVCVCVCVCLCVCVCMQRISIYEVNAVLEEAGEAPSICTSKARTFVLVKQVRVKKKKVSPPFSRR